MGFVKQKLITVPAELWKEIERFQRANGLSANEAILNLIKRGLAAISSEPSK
jgi:hypothetical protein